MSIEIIQEKLLSYECKTILDQENALKEIAQEIALMALSRAGFFKHAAFQGGTCLRILYQLPRFSEDLDFILLKPNPNFDWEPYVTKMDEEFKPYGYELSITNKSKLNKAVKTAFLKADSSGGILILKDLRTNRPKCQIKLEIDSNPPAGSTYAINYLDFPANFSVLTQDLPSLFAGKLHALLCRNDTKGRDWFDFSWYVTKKTTINMNFLADALHQSGHLTETNHFTHESLIDRLKTKIKQIDWEETKHDVARFLKPREFAGLKIWSEAFFMSKLEKLNELTTQ